MLKNENNGELSVNGVHVYVCVCVGRVGASVDEIPHFDIKANRRCNFRSPKFTLSQQSLHTQFDEIARNDLCNYRGSLYYKITDGYAECKVVSVSLPTSVNTKSS